MLLDALCQSTGVPDVFPGYPAGLRSGQLPDTAPKSYFLTLFGKSERVTACACERNGEVTMPQLLRVAKEENLSDYTGLKKQDLIFKILKERVKQNGLMFGDGTLEVLHDGFGFRAIPRQDGSAEDVHEAVHRRARAVQRVRERPHRPQGVV